MAFSLNCVFINILELHFSPDGCISILEFSTYGNAGIKHGVTLGSPRYLSFLSGLQPHQVISLVTKE